MDCNEIRARTQKALEDTPTRVLIRLSAAGLAEDRSPLEVVIDEIHEALQRDPGTNPDVTAIVERTLGPEG